jgi:hypothetical protein
MNNNTKNGYAIMFTVILVSIISLIGIGLSNTTYKQLLLSSGAKDSQVAFYMSDMATECALYADNSSDEKIDFTDPENPPQATIECGIKENGDPYILELDPESYLDSSLDSGNGYSLKPQGLEDSNEPCLRIAVGKKDITETIEGEEVFYTKTTIRASGYNICNQSSPRTVERTIEVRY